MEQTFSLTIEPAAIAKVSQIIKDENNDALKLRIFITGGGCSGFQYGFTLDDSTDEDDFSTTIDNVGVVIDPMSYQYLVGSTVDYTHGVAGESFVIKNPNAKSTCGCGSSFSA